MTTVEKRQPVFVKVESLRPSSKGVTLNVKVTEAKSVGTRKGPKGVMIKVSECIVGDATGSIVFAARNEQVELAVPGSFLTLRNAKVEMFKGSMRIIVDQWGKVEEASDDVSFSVKLDNNLSLIEFELVTLPLEQAHAAAVVALA